MVEILDWVKVGDKVTFADKYKKRTFWQWLLRKPKELQVYIITQEYPCMKYKPQLTKSEE